MFSTSFKASVLFKIKFLKIQDDGKDIYGFDQQG